MRFPDGRDLKRNVEDQLRGVRHLVRLLGSDDDRNRLARKTLPEPPAELERFVGRTFRVVDGIMTAVESAAQPFRTPRPAPPGFRPASVYFGNAAPADAEESRAALVDDLYRVLKLAAQDRLDNSLLLKTRLTGVHDDLFTKVRAAVGQDAPQPVELCLALFLSLARHHPFAGAPEPDQDTAVHLYAAVTLVFGLTSLGASETDDAATLLTDAMLISGARLETFVKTAREGGDTSELKKVLETLLSHLG